MPTYLVTDIEADGLVPGRHSMISIASVAVDQQGSELGRFTANLVPLSDKSSDPGTMAWWGSRPDAWRDATTGAVEASVVMTRLVSWAQQLPGPRIFTAHPVSFDGAYVAWYLDRFGNVPLYDTPRQAGLTTSALDLPSLVMGVMGWDFDRCGGHGYPDEWLGGNPHSHRAIDDALGYAVLLKTMLAKHSGGGSG
jgi:hypothetical protein